MLEGEGVGGGGARGGVVEDAPDLGSGGLLQGDGDGGEGLGCVGGIVGSRGAVEPEVKEARVASGLGCAQGDGGVGDDAGDAEGLQE